MVALSVNRRITIATFGNDIAGHFLIYVRRCHGKGLCSTGQCKACGLPCLRTCPNLLIREVTSAYQIMYRYILFAGDCDLRQIIRIVRIGQFHIEGQNIYHIFCTVFNRLPAHGHRLSTIYTFNGSSDVILLSLRKVHLKIKIVLRFGAFRLLCHIIFLTVKLLARLRDAEGSDLPRFRPPSPVDVKPQPRVAQRLSDLHGIVGLSRLKIHLCLILVFPNGYLDVLLSGQFALGKIVKLYRSGSPGNLAGCFPFLIFQFCGSCNSLTSHQSYIIYRKLQRVCHSLRVFEAYRSCDIQLCLPANADTAAIIFVVSCSIADISVCSDFPAHNGNFPAGHRLHRVSIVSTADRRSLNCGIGSIYHGGGSHLAAGNLDLIHMTGAPAADSGCTGSSGGIDNAAPDDNGSLGSIAGAADSGSRGFQHAPIGIGSALCIDCAAFYDDGSELLDNLPWLTRISSRSVGADTRCASVIAASDRFQGSGALCGNRQGAVLPDADTSASDAALKHIVPLQRQIQLCAVNQLDCRRRGIPCAAVNAHIPYRQVYGRTVYHDPLSRNISGLVREAAHQNRIVILGHIACIDRKVKALGVVRCERQLTQLHHRSMRLYCLCRVYAVHARRPEGGTRKEARKQKCRCPSARPAQTAHAPLSAVSVFHFLLFSKVLFYRLIFHNPLPHFLKILISQ